MFRTVDVHAAIKSYPDNEWALNFQKTVVRVFNETGLYVHGGTEEIELHGPDELVAIAQQIFKEELNIDLKWRKL